MSVNAKLEELKLKYLTQLFLKSYENVTCREREGEKIER
jgi:hypothetical protein